MRRAQLRDSKSRRRALLLYRRCGVTGKKNKQTKKKRRHPKKETHPTASPAIWCGVRPASSFSVAMAASVRLPRAAATAAAGLLAGDEPPGANKRDSFFDLVLEARAAKDRSEVASDCVCEGGGEGGVGGVIQWRGWAGGRGGGAACERGVLRNLRPAQLGQQGGVFSSI